jgi:cytosine/adenosine deaminase-related metal-dependent hydrolase
MKYYFNTHNGDDGTHVDDVGEDLPDSHAAWDMATKFAAEALRDLDGKLRKGRPFKLEVVDQANKVIFRIVVKGEDLN